MATVVWEEREGVGLIRFNRPQSRNAIDNEMYGAIADALQWAQETAAVRAVLIHGEGPAFCSGRELGDIGNPPEGVSMQAYLERSQRIRLRQVELPKPVIAAIHGPTLGAGAQMALGADFRIAGESLKFGFPETGIGLVVDTGASAMVTALAGPARAKWLLMSGAQLTAAEALDWGLVEWVVPDAELFDLAFDKARALARRSPVALAHSKALVDAHWTDTLRAGLRQELVVQAHLMSSPEFAAVRARLLQPKALTTEG
jgi:enoyl-CoA hydratase/carnithine racemase